jgi:hypothetical protein
MAAPKIVFLFLASTLASRFFSQSTPPSSEPQPVIVELFTSEGCSSCPPADSLLKKLSEEQPFDGVQIIPLEEHVDYWNHLGWTDPFSSPDFSRRQESYATTLPDGGVYTPQMIVDGRAQFVGSRTGEARDQIRSASAHPKSRLLLTPAAPTNAHTRSFELRLEPNSALANSSALDLWIAISEKGLHSNVTEGENSGQALYHAPIVRQLRKQQSVSLPLNAPLSFSIKLDGNWNSANVTVVAFLAHPRSHQILAAGCSPLAP